MHKRLRIFKFKLILLKVKINEIMHKKKYKVNVCILSSEKYKNKILEDIYLKYYLNKAGIGATIVSYLENIDYSKYDYAIIRSVWGIYDNINLFKNVIKNLEKNKVKVFNNYNIICNNLNKEKQYELLSKYKIKTIKTIFTDGYTNIDKIWNENFNEDKKIVVKPTMSESGNDTILVDKLSLKDIINKESKKRLMVEPFIESVKNGEISIILFNNKIMYGVKRYSGVFYKYKNTEYIPISDINKKIIKSVNEIIKIDEYKESLYTRIDFVYHDSEYLVMEIELIDPMLFLTVVPKNENIYTKFISEIKKRFK